MRDTQAQTPHVKPRPLTMRISEVAAQLGVCTNTVRNEYRRGRLKGRRCGRLILITTEGFEEYLAGRGD